MKNIKVKSKNSYRLVNRFTFVTLEEQKNSSCSVLLEKKKRERVREIRLVSSPYKFLCIFPQGVTDDAAITMLVDLRLDKCHSHCISITRMLENIWTFSIYRHSCNTSPDCRQRNEQHYRILYMSQTREHTMAYRIFSAWFKSIFVLQYIALKLTH